MAPSAQTAFDAVAIEGGLPVIIDGRMIGAVASSGALPEQDEACVAAGIKAAMQLPSQSGGSCPARKVAIVTGKVMRKT